MYRLKVLQQIRCQRKLGKLIAPKPADGRCVVAGDRLAAHLLDKKVMYLKDAALASGN